MNKILPALCIIFGAIILLAAYAWLGAGSQVLGTKSFGMFLTVGDKLGFNIDSNAVYFGKSIQGSFAKRDLLVSNNFSEKVLVDIEKSGDLGAWVEPDLKEFYLEGGETKTITLLATIPPDAKKADYNGLVTVYYIKAHN